MSGAIVVPTQPHYEDLVTAPPREYELCDIKQYTKVKELGSGSYGSVAIYNNRKGTEVAVKSATTEGQLPSIIREIEIYKKICHPNIVSYISHRYGKTTSYLVLERGRCDLSNFISDIRPEIYNITSFNRWCYEILRAIKYLHDLRLIHTDLKPPNVIMYRDENHLFYPKLADLGCCQHDLPFLAGNLPIYIQTEYYRSPEVRNQHLASKERGKYDCKIDIWSFGVIVADVFCHEFTYTAIKYYDKGHILALWQYLQKKTPFKGQLSTAQENGLLDLLTQALQMDPQLRGSAENLLRHNYWELCGVKGTAAGQTTIATTAVATSTVAGAFTEVTGNDASLVVIPTMPITPAPTPEMVPPTLRQNGKVYRKAIFGYPTKYEEIIVEWQKYYADLPPLIVRDSFFYALKVKAELPNIPLLRLFQYCMYILVQFYGLSNRLSVFIYGYRKDEIFDILNATKFVLF